jgi:transcription initiation factor TFIID subunit 15
MKKVVLVVLTGMFGGALLLQSCEKDVFEPNGGNPSNNDSTYVDPNDSTIWNGGGGNCGGDTTIWNGGGGNPGDSTIWNGGGGNNGGGNNGGGNNEGDSTIWNGGGGNPGDSLPNGN